MSNSTTGRTLFRGGTIVTMDPRVPNLLSGDVLVDGTRIAAVGVNLQADDVEVSTPRAASSCLEWSMRTIICGSA